MRCSGITEAACGAVVLLRLRFSARKNFAVQLANKCVVTSLLRSTRKKDELEIFFLADDFVSYVKKIATWCKLLIDCSISLCDISGVHRSD